MNHTESHNSGHTDANGHKTGPDSQTEQSAVHTRNPEQCDNTGGITVTSRQAYLPDMISRLANTLAVRAPIPGYVVWHYQTIGLMDLGG